MVKQLGERKPLALTTAPRRVKRQILMDFGEQLHMYATCSKNFHNRSNIA